MNATETNEIVRTRTADDAWRTAAARLLAMAGENAVQASRVGDTIELLQCQFRVQDPVQRWTFSRLPPINVAFALAEVVWILAGRDDLALPTFFNRRYPEFVGTVPSVHGAYGFRLRRHLGFDQLERAAAALAGTEHSRQVVLQIWDGTRDMPDGSGAPVSRDVPCNVVSMLKVRAGRLEWTQVLRSNDLFLGMPHNFVQFTTLQEVLAGWIGVEVGTYTHFADSLHLYTKDLAGFGLAPVTLPAENSDSLRMPLSQFKMGFAELERRTETIISDTTIAAIEAAALWQGSAKCFANIILVLGAFALRKRGEIDRAEGVIAHCDNPAFRLLWSNWSQWRAASRRTS